MTDGGDSSQQGGRRSDTMAAVNPVRSLGSGSLEEPGIESSQEMAASDTLAAQTSDNLADSDTLAAADVSTPRGASGPIVRQGRGRREGLEGRTIAGRYAIIEPLGKGGMSEVFVARHELLKKIVAVKVLKEELATSKAALERFHREAIAAAAIGDPHIVDVTDYGFTEDGDAFIVMECLEGQDLRRLLRKEGALPTGRAVAIARQILRGLRAAHERTIIHRDLKAENVFLTKRDDVEFVKLLDFGISKLRSPTEDQEGGGQSLTSTGMVMGTPQYIAPEQAHAHADLDHRVDIYAMGVILYEMLTGTLPFSGDTALELMMKHVQDVPEPPRKRRPDLHIPAYLEAVVLKALSKDRDDRYATAQEMLDALPRSEDLSGGYASIGTATASPLPRPTRWPAVVVGVALLALGGGLVAWRLLGGKGTDPAPPRPGTTAPVLKPDAAPRPDVQRAKPDLLARDLSAQGTVELDVTPTKAEIFLADQLVGRGKVKLRRPVGSALDIRVKAKGYRAFHREIQVKAGTLHETIRLQRRSRRPHKPPHKGRNSDTKPNPYAQ